MAHFYRDELVSNLAIDESALMQLSAVYENRRQEINNTLVDENDPNNIFLTYIIRFDNKGYRVFSYQELLQYFHQAKVIERIVITIESSQALRSSRQTGTYMELRLDEVDPKSSHLIVTSDNRNWVDASFSEIKEILGKCKTNTGWLRSQWALLSIQIMGVIAGFTISLWGASIISPKLNIEQSFVISFIFSLLIFSNLWGFLNQKIIMWVNKVFPNVKIYRPDKDKYHWLQQAIVGGIAAAVTLYILGYIFAYIGDVLGKFIN